MHCGAAINAQRVGSPARLGRGRLARPVITTAVQQAEHRDSSDPNNYCRLLAFLNYRCQTKPAAHSRVCCSAAPFRRGHDFPPHSTGPRHGCVYAFGFAIQHLTHREPQRIVARRKQLEDTRLAPLRLLDQRIRRGFKERKGKHNER